MADEAVSPLFFTQPAYAVVVGISKYQNFQEPDDNKRLEPKNFRNLKVAAKDAKDFATYLATHGFIPDNVISLLDAEATRTGIRGAFKKLRTACKAAEPKKPLVVVYFSGHGMVDDEDTHYLAPHEAERNHLYETAISNKEFDDLLNSVNTSRLVVFLDACHAGAFTGAETEGAKGETAAAGKYDSSRGLGEGAGQMIIGSCLPGQNSYESGGNGIFTSKLLELLNGTSPYFQDEEEITTVNLYTRLREEVLEASDRRQEPQINKAVGTTGIVLAINQRARERREGRENEGRQRKRDFLEAVINYLRTMKGVGSTSTVARAVRNYSEKSVREEGFESLYQLFDEHFGDWEPGADFIVLRCCKFLMDEYAEASVALRSKAKVGVTEPSNRPDAEPSKPLDRLETAQHSSLTNPLGPAQPPPPGLSDQQTPRRLPESALRTARLENDKQ